MIDYAPVLIATLFVVMAFLIAMHQGVVVMLNSGISLAVALAVLLVGVEWGPALARQYFDIELSWKFLLGVCGGLALFVFLVTRLILSFVLRALFNRDGFLHPLSDGIGGGVISLGPSLLTALVFFLCVRLAGTVLELNHIDSLARPGISAMGGGIPPYPLSTRWRDALDSLPFMGDALDAIDPFSPRAERNAAALALSTKGAALDAYLKREPETGPLAELPDWQLLLSDPGVAKANAGLDRLALLMSPAVASAAGNPATRSRLQRLVLRPTVTRFVKSLEPELPADGLESQF